MLKFKDIQNVEQRQQKNKTKQKQNKNKNNIGFIIDAYSLYW